MCSTCIHCTEVNNAKNKIEYKLNPITVESTDTALVKKIDVLNRYSIDHNLLLRENSVSKNENIRQLIFNIGRYFKLNLDTDDFDAFRLKAESATNHPPTILIKFMDISLENEYMTPFQTRLYPAPAKSLHILHFI